MRKLTATVAAALIAALGIAAAHEISNAQEPTPPGTLLADGYAFSIGSVADSDCNIYVAEGGIPGETGQITRVDATTGEKTVVASGIPNTALEGAAFGAIDVTLLDGDVYYLLTGQDDPEMPNGVYKVEDDGSSTLVADIGQFNLDNTVEFPDAIPTGNPYSITPYEDGFLVADGNFNRLLKVGLDGSIEILVSLDNVVPTGATISPDGKIVWAQIGPFPHNPQDGKVQELDGTPMTLASGLSNVIDVKFGSDGTLYALTMGDQDATGENPAIPFTGKLVIVNDDGTFSPIVEGFMFATSFEICDGDAYVTGLAGDTRVVADIGDLEPLEPTPTATPTATATQPAPTATATATMVAPGPPATGTGTSGSPPSIAWLAILGFGIALGGAGLAIVSRRRA